MAMVLTLGGCAADAAHASLLQKIATNKAAQSLLKAAPSHVGGSFLKNSLWNGEIGTQIVTANKEIKLFSNDVKIRAVVHKLKKYAGKTWYVFSGSTPSGWDCSGLVMWTYQQLGVSLEHRASAQSQSGKRVLYKHALPGDIVAFYYPGYQSAYHVGIYLGKGQMIDAPRPGIVTKIESINDYPGSKVKFIRILPRIDSTKNA